jgi:hypothetical protein
MPDLSIIDHKKEVAAGRKNPITVLLKHLPH